MAELGVHGLALESWSLLLSFQEVPPFLSPAALRVELTH